MKVETDIIASITESPSGYAVIMYVETFKTEVIVVINFYHHHIIFSIMISPLVLKIFLGEIKGHMYKLLIIHTIG
jgi:hypothetical protein